jgi:hypothetical protein
MTSLPPTWVGVDYLLSQVSRLYELLPDLPLVVAGQLCQGINPCMAVVQRRCRLPPRPAKQVNLRNNLLARTYRVNARVIERV